MKIDDKKLRRLLAGELLSTSADELRREENVFFVGGNLPERQTLQTLFESHFQSHAALFHLSFGELDRFPNAENLARVIKKNFNIHLVGRFDFAPTPQLIARAYAAGVDIIDIPLGNADTAEEKKQREARLQGLADAGKVFPRWSVASTLVAGAAPASSTKADVDTLLAADVVPLVSLCSRADGLPGSEIAAMYTSLNNGWQSRKAVIKPLLPLIYLCTPFVPAPGRGMVRELFDIIDDRRLLATSDLRRLLRVKEVEESYASSGL